MATCADCAAEFDVDEFDVDRGDELSCPECGANLEVVGLAPVALDLAGEDDDDAGAMDIDGGNGGFGRHLDGDVDEFD